jgi:uncharacterized protein YaiE (UPF0345 family)
MADKVDFNGLAPSKTIKDDQGKEASMIVSKMANGSKTCMKASCMKGWNWTTGAKPILPGCPDWCPATHFGYLKKGKMEVRMKDEDKWMTFEEGDTYFVPPGHLPRFPEDTEFVEFSQDPVYVKLAEGTQADATPAPAPAPVNLPPGKINYAGMPPTKTMKDGSGKAASMIMGKFANGAKTVNRITIEEGFEWSSGVKPHLPGCPEHCPATHFGFIERGQMEIKMAGSEEWTVFGPGKLSCRLPVACLAPLAVVAGLPSKTPLLVRHSVLFIDCCCSLSLSRQATLITCRPATFLASPRAKPL